MKAWFLCLGIAFLACRLPAAEPVFDSTGNYLPLLDRPMEKLSTELQKIVEAVKASKVPSQLEARQAVQRSEQKGSYMFDARTLTRATAVIRIGRAVPGFASESDFIWVVQAEWQGVEGPRVMQIYYVCASTGKVLPAFSEAPNRVPVTD